MDDHFDDFDNDFDEGEFMDDDSFEDMLDGDFEWEEPLDQEIPIEHNSLDDNDENDDEKYDLDDPFILGGAMGLAFEAGLEERDHYGRISGSKRRPTGLRSAELRRNRNRQGHDKR